MVRGKMWIFYGIYNWSMTEYTLQHQNIPPFIIKWLAKVWRNTCVIWPAGNFILVFFIAVLNVESLQFFGNSLPVRLGICFDKAVDIGAERGLLPLVLTNVTMLFAICLLRRFTASPHRQPVLKHIFVMTCSGYKKTISDCLCFSILTPSIGLPFVHSSNLVNLLNSPHPLTASLIQECRQK